MSDRRDPSPPPHRRTMRRAEEPGHARFLTFSCYRRLPLLDHDCIRLMFVERLRAVCTAERVDLLGWVVMPEHVHLMLFPRSEAGGVPPDLHRFTHTLKRPFAEAVLRRWKSLDAPILSRIAHGRGYRYWQAGGGYDHNLTEPEKIREKITYMHDNPVRRGIADTATDYAWSSARWYAGMPESQIACDPLPW